MRSRLLPLALLIACAASGTAHATVARRLDLDELVRSADGIVVAKAVRSQARALPGGMIVTDVEVSVEDAVKGPLLPGATVTIELLGGEVDGLGTYVAGEATLAPGEEAVLFLALRGTAAGGTSSGARPVARVVGMSQGKLSVVRDAQGRARVAPSTAGLDFLGGAPPDPALGSARSLDDFLADVARRVDGRTPPPR